MTCQSKCCPRASVPGADLSPDEYARALEYFRTLPCGQYGHPWDPECLRTWLNLWGPVFLSSFKLYAPLYFIPALLYRRKDALSLVTRTLPDTCRSAAFLATFATGFCVYFCTLRRLIGANYVYTNALIPGFLASLTSLPIEGKNRRTELALYCANQALSAMFKMLVDRGVVHSRRGGDGLIVACALSVLLYFHAKHPQNLGNGVSGLLNFLFGREEQSPCVKECDAAKGGKAAETSQGGVGEHTSQQSNGHEKQRARGSHWLLALIARSAAQAVPEGAREALCSEHPRHATCNHRLNCVAYALSGLVRSFGVGFAIKGVVALLSTLARDPKNPRKALGVAFGKNNALTGAFLGAIVGGYRAIVCGLRHATGEDKGRHHALAGFAVGWAALLAPSQELSMWLLAKAGEAAYYRGAELGLTRRWYHGDLLLFAVSCAILFHASIFEPHNIRQSYWDFLMRASDGKFAILKRDHVGFLGYDALRRQREEAARRASRK